MELTTDTVPVPFCLQQGDYILLNKNWQAEVRQRNQNGLVIGSRDGSKPTWFFNIKWLATMAKEGDLELTETKQDRDDAFIAQGCATFGLEVGKTFTSSTPDEPYLQITRILRDHIEFSVIAPDGTVLSLPEPRLVAWSEIPDFLKERFEETPSKPADETDAFWAWSIADMMGRATLYTEHLEGLTPAGRERLQSLLKQLQRKFSELEKPADELVLLNDHPKLLESELAQSLTSWRWSTKHRGVEFRVNPKYRNHWLNFRNGCCYDQLYAHYAVINDDRGRPLRISCGTYGTEPVVEFIYR